MSLEFVKGKMEYSIANNLNHVITFINEPGHLYINVFAD